MLAQLRHLAHTGAQVGFLKPSSDASSSIYQRGSLTSSLLLHFRHEWIKSFIRYSAGRYQFLWVDSIDQHPYRSRMTIGWQTALPIPSPQPPLIFEPTSSTTDDHLCVRYVDPVREINVLGLADERTRFWKKYLSQRQRLECLSSKQNQFVINYRLAADIEPYQLESIRSNEDASFDLQLNLNHTLMTLLLDSQMQQLHPLLSAHQIGMQTNEKTLELCSYLSKLLTYKHQLRLVRLNGNRTNDSIPFHIVLDDDSLKNGVCSVWNRDTQLREQIHVKQVAKRLADYFQALDDAL